MDGFSCSSNATRRLSTADDYQFIVYIEGGKEASLKRLCLLTLLACLLACLISEVPRDQELQPEPPEQFNSLEEENYDKSDMGEKDTPVDEEDKDMNVDEPEVEDEEADVHIPKETPDDDNKEDLKDNEPAEAEPQANGYKNEEDVEPKQEEANNQDENKTQVAS